VGTSNIACGTHEVNRFRLTKADRLLKRSDFINLSKTGKTVGNRFFLAKFDLSSTGKTRLGITVTKKVGNAVKRNKLKRVIRESFRLHRIELVGTWDINMIAKNAAAELTTHQSFSNLKDIFEKISRSVDY
jgi:ribonuclease P protein component